MAQRTPKPEEDVIAPLYDRLPRGPHRMGRGEVTENQRQRMLGAMVEAVAANGYGRTSVKQVVSLAGVSRRAFYEQFANKQECFLATLDLVARRAAARIAETYRLTEGKDAAERMRAALGGFAELVASNPKSAHVVLIDAPSAGPAGWLKLTRMLLTFERMLSTGFADGPDACALPMGVVRSVAGGLSMMTFARLRDQRTDELLQLADDMAEWVLAFRAPSAAALHGQAHSSQPGAPSAQERTALDGEGVCRNGAPAERERPLEAQMDCEQVRARLVDSALTMAALEGYANLSPLRIVDQAGVSIDTFFSLFGDVEECFLTALADVSRDVRRRLSQAESASDDWPSAVRHGLELLLGYLASRPSRAHMIATGAFEMGPPGIELNLKLAHDVAARLTEGAPRSGPEPHKPNVALVREGLAGAIWHTVYCHVMGRKIHKLPDTVSQLAYVVLAPFMGGERAIEALTEKRPHRLSSIEAPRVQRTTDRVGSAL